MESSSVQLTPDTLEPSSAALKPCVTPTILSLMVSIAEGGSMVSLLLFTSPPKPPTPSPAVPPLPPPPAVAPAAALAFLIAGPTTTLPAMAAVWGLVSRRVFALYLLFVLLGAIVLGYAYALVG